MPPDRPVNRTANLYAGDYVDRRATDRETDDWADRALEDPGALFLVMRGTLTLMQLDDDGAPRAARFLGRDDPRLGHLAARELTLLGWFEGARCLLVATTEDEVPTLPNEAFHELRPFASRLPEREAGLLAYARALAIWRANHRFCGRCGEPMQPSRAGHVLVCRACGQHHFPRIDPAIIVLVSDGERALLGRQASWPAQRYSTIAGFVEPGEALEDAVRREVLEESGIAITACRYHSSQPWPFPSSLMLGFEATSEGGDPYAGDSELEDVRWFSREEVRDGVILLPPAESISRRLIEEWLGGHGVR